MKAPDFPRPPGMTKPLIIAVAVSVLLAILTFAGIAMIESVFREELAIDACLDQGGRWDYARAQCVTRESEATFGNGPLKR